MLWLSFLLPCLGAFLLIGLLQRSFPLASPYLWVGGSLAVGLGLGLSSLVYFCALLLGASKPGLMYAETMAWLLASLLFLYALKRMGAGSLSLMANRSAIYRILLGSFLIVLLSASATWLLLSLHRPHGDWDAWAIWNMRARFISRAGADWTVGFADILGWSHPDYPLLLPALVARGWQYAGRELLLVPATLSILFSLATLALLSASVAAARGRSQGLLAGIVLLGTPAFIEQGSAQKADIPLAFYYLATLVLVFLRHRLNRPALLWLAGMMAGLSAWTKNEGILFVGALVLAQLFFLRKQSGLLREGALFAGGLLAPLALLGYFKAFIAPPNDLLAHAASLPWLGGLRYWEAARTVRDELIHWSASPAALLPASLLAYSFTAGFEPESKDRRLLLAGFTTVAVVLGGYLFAYVISPYDLRWHVRTSLARLLLQLWPACLFLLFLCVRAPERLKTSP